MSPNDKAKKISISVPESVLARAQAQRPSMSTSGLITLALEAQVRDLDAAGYSLERPTSAAGRFAEVKAQLAVKARDEYEAGYLAGVEVAGEISLHLVEALRDYGYNVTHWVQPILNGADMADLSEDKEPSSALVPLVEALGSLMSPYGDDMFTPTEPYLRGFAQAFRDLYEEVTEGVSTEIPTLPGPAHFASANGTGSEGDASGQ